MATIQQSIALGYLCAAFGSIATLALIYDFARTRRKRFTLPVAGLLMLVHPAWTVSAIHGDCGFAKREASYVLTAVFIGLLIYQYVDSRRDA
jgi:hypothetical protein